MRIIILFVILILFSVNTNAQIKNKNILDKGIYILPTQLIFPEIILSYEHFIKKRISLSYSLGYKIPIGKGETFNEVGHGGYAIYEYQYMFNKFSNAVYISIAPSFYFKNRRYFLQAEFFNRIYGFDRKQLSFNNIETYRYSSIRSERNNVTGIKILAGINLKKEMSKSLFLNIKLYYGFGLRYKTGNYENINYKYIDIHNVETKIPYLKEYKSTVVPSFHLGIKIGIAKKIE